MVELVGKQLIAGFAAAICERQIVHSSPIPAIFRQGRLRRPGAQSLHAANAAHTVNGRNARSVHFTFACVAMTGEVCNRGAAVFLSAVFSGAATPAPWASAAVGHHYACAVPPGGARRACPTMQRRRERLQERLCS